MNRTLTTATMAGVILLGLAAAAPAATITQTLWRMGEDNAGAVAGNTVNAVGEDNTNDNDLTRNGTPTYVAPGAGVASSLAVTFGPDAGPDYYSGTVSGLAADRGIEMWLRLENDGSRHDAMWTGGLGILNYSSTGYDKITFHQAGSGDKATFTFVDDQWYNVALVTIGGTTTFYVDGVPTGSTGSVSISDSFVIGNYASGYDFPWDGAIDHVRVFDVTDGTFDPMTDLTLTLGIPEPVSIVLLSVGGVGVLVRRRRR